MKPHFHDILALTDQQPQWFMPDGTPRFCPFTPQEAGVYLAEVALVEICCQNCKHPFLVAITTDVMDAMRRSVETKDHVPPIEHQLKTNREWFGYGDPPNLECCPAGITMGSLALRVVEYWAYRRDENDQGIRSIINPMTRNPAYEMVLPAAAEYAADIAHQCTLYGYPIPECVQAILSAKPEQ